MEKSALARTTSGIAGAVFWTIVFGLVMSVDVVDDLASSDPSYAFDSLLVMFALVTFSMAYPVLRRKGWGFLVNMGMGAFFVVATIAVDGLDNPDAYTGMLLVFVGLLTVYANYLGFLETRGARPG